MHIDFRTIQLDVHFASLFIMEHLTMREIIFCVQMETGEISTRIVDDL